MDASALTGDIAAARMQAHILAAINASSEVDKIDNGQLDDLPASKITSGEFALARIPATLTGKDADTVDGIEGSDILKKDGSVAMTGDLDMGGAVGEPKFIINMVGLESPDDDSIALVGRDSEHNVQTWVIISAQDKAFYPAMDSDHLLGKSTKKWSDIYGVNAHFDNYNLIAGDIPNLATSKITSGAFALDRIPTGIQGKLTAACSFLYSHPSAPACQAATTLNSGHATATQIGKLAGIAPGATKYPDTGEQAFLDADHNKLNGIEAGATADQTKADIDALDINAGQVDGIEGADICQTSGFSMTGNIECAGGASKIFGFGILEGAAASDVNIKAVSGELIPCTSLILKYNSKLFYPENDNDTQSGFIFHRWSDIYAVNTHWGDLGFTETTCPICNKKFKLADSIILKVIRFDEEDSGIMTIPIHAECANLPPKTFTKKYAIKEDYYVWDEDKGEKVKSKRNKVASKIITKKKLKEDYEVDETTGDFWKMKWQLKEGHSYDVTTNKYYDSENNEVKKHEATEKVKDKKATITEATEEVQEEIQEVLYEEKEFMI